MRIETALAVILVGVVAASPGNARPQEPALSNERPALEVDLRKFGYEVSNYIRPRFLEFTDTNTVAWAWVTVDKSPSLARKPKKYSPPQPVPSHFHVLTLDAQTGQQQGQQEWPTPYFPICFSGLSDGRFFTCTGNIFRLFSPNFEIVREQQDLLPANALADFDLQSGFRISPSKQSLLVFYPSGANYQAKLVDIKTSSVIATQEEEKKIELNAIADNLFIGFCGEPRQMCIRGINQS